MARAGKVVGGLGRRDVVNEKTGIPSPDTPGGEAKSLGLRALYGELGEESLGPGDWESKPRTCIIRTTYYCRGVQDKSTTAPLDI
jgi:hypothetical protein